MIINIQPDRPEKKTNQRFIGYWASKEDLSACHYAEKGIFLPWPGDFIDNSWDAQERATVVAYLNNAPDVEFWRGFPSCRLGCSYSSNLGSTDKSDFVYVWPAGFGHYVEVHGVKPPAEFIRHVLNNVKSQALGGANNHIVQTDKPEDYDLWNAFNILNKRR